MRRGILNQFPHHLHSLQRALKEEAGGWRARKENTDPPLGPLEVGSADRCFCSKFWFNLVTIRQRQREMVRSLSFSLLPSLDPRKIGVSSFTCRVKRIT